MASDKAKERRAAKRGAGRVAEAERIQSDVAAFWDERKRTAGELLPGLFPSAGRLPDDDKPMSGKGAGRPVGAKATSPAEYRRFILATKGDFLGRLAGIAAADTLDLARVLGCTPLEALQMQQKLAATAAPYVYTPQAKPDPAPAGAYWAGMLFVPAGGAAPAQQDALAALAGRPPDLEEIQALGPVEFEQSEPAQSEPEDKAP